MKKLIMLLLAIVIVLQVQDMSLYGQRGNGRGPSVNQGQGRGPAQIPNHDRGNARIENRNPRSTERPNTKVANSIERNPRLSSRLQEMLPPGMTVAQASSGFKNQGQFIAALHVSKNLNIPFDQMKAKMTGDNAMSLGQAIHELRPDMPEDRAKSEAKRADEQRKATERGKSTT